MSTVCQNSPVQLHFYLVVERSWVCCAPIWSLYYLHLHDLLLAVVAVFVAVGCWVYQIEQVLPTS